MNSRENSTVARLVCDERTAKRIADSVSESFDSAATAAFVSIELSGAAMEFAAFSAAVTICP